MSSDLSKTGENDKLLEKSSNCFDRKETTATNVPTSTKTVKTWPKTSLAEVENETDDSTSLTSEPDNGKLKMSKPAWTLGGSTFRSSGYQTVAELRRKSDGQQYDSVLSPPASCRKHSSGDLHSRLKTRKLLGVGETDDGDVHRSKLSQILGHSDQLYIRLPNGLRIWQFVLALIFSLMAVWTLLFPVHFYSTMFDVAEETSLALPIRLYATALVALALVYWSTLQASDREVIRLVLLSSVAFFILQTLVKGGAWLLSGSLTTRKMYFLCCQLGVALISMYFYRETALRQTSGLRRTTSNKDVRDKDHEQ